MFDLVLFVGVDFEGFPGVVGDLFELDFGVGDGLFLPGVVALGGSIAEFGFAVGLGVVSFGVNPADVFAVGVRGRQFICNFIRHHYQLYIFFYIIKFN